MENLIPISSILWKEKRPPMGMSFWMLQFSSLCNEIFEPENQTFWAKKKSMDFRAYLG